MSEKYLYLVALSLPPTWKDNTFTYHSSEKLDIGTVVIVPFGNSEKIGYIKKEVEKSTIDTKALVAIKPATVLNETGLKLQDWMNAAYPNMNGSHAQLLLPQVVKDSRLFKKSEDEALSKPKLPDLTTIQKNAIETIESDDKPVVLHGITGSGKTRIYQELAQKVINKGKNVLILYPEISLTSHIKSALEEIVPDNKLHVYHSRNTIKEQRQTWFSACYSEGGDIFIGPRSALFLPIKNLGLIVLDEAHDSSYKQDSGSHYNGLMTAGALAKLSGAKLILGSATPPIQETYFIKKSGGNIVCIHELAKSSSFSKSYEIVDMTDKSNLKSGSQLLSKSLFEELESTLSNGHQSLLYLNRRGTARSVICSDCGWIAMCNICNSPLTYHHDVNRLVCHVCGNSQSIYTSCPDCGAVLSLKSPGTKALESELRKLFPSAKIMRFDSDNKKSESVSENYSDVRGGKVDIIIGTQLITKGLDLPKLTTVGVINADSTLSLPDYSSLERGFQQLTQVSGRTGRGHNDGRIIIQSFNPSSELLKLVKTQDWHKFYDKELEQRKASGFPPFSFLLKIWTVKKSAKSAESAAKKLVDSLKDKSDIRILGPAPSYYPKIAGKNSWQLLVFSKSRSSLSSIASNLPKDSYYDLDPVSLL